MQYTEENNYPKAFGATALIMSALFALCFLLTFSLPPKVEDGVGGILVNYGTTDEGSGSDFMSLDEPSKSEKANKSQPTKATNNDESTPSSDNSNQKVVTQNSEDAPVVSDKKNTSTSTAAQAQKPEPQRVPDQRALFKGMKNNGTGQGDGTTGTPGNQGSPNGSNLADNYGPGGSGNGLSLSHWEFVSTPDVKNIHRVPGIVIINFTIDQHGNVIQTSVNRKSRATLDQIQECESKLKNSKLKSDSPASGNQSGTMTWRFNVD